MLARTFNRLRFRKTLDRHGPGGETALTAAIKMNDDASAERFIDCGASVDRPNAQGEYPVFLALQMKNEKIFRLLIEENASIRPRQGGMTLGEYAQEQGMEAEARVIAGVAEQERVALHATFAPMGVGMAPPSRGVVYRELQKPKK